MYRPDSGPAEWGRRDRCGHHAFRLRDDAELPRAVGGLDGEVAKHPVDVVPRRVGLVADLEDELALTVLRSTGLISRNENRYREDPAGPSLPIPDAQMHGPWSFSFAYLPSIDHVLENAEAYRLPFLTAAGRGSDGELTLRAGPSLEGHGVVLTSLRPQSTRLVNESPFDVEATFAGRKLSFGPWQIQTTTHE